MSAGIALLRDKRFHKWYIDKMIEFMTRAKGYSKEQCQVKLADSFVEEMNSLHFIISNFFPHSRPSNDKTGFLFITEPIEHDLFTAPGGGRKYYPGKLILSFDGVSPLMEFPDQPTFRHGHIIQSSKKVHCYGTFNSPETIASDEGFAGLLAQMYLFATKAKYGTTINGESTPVTL